MKSHLLDYRVPVFVKQRSGEPGFHVLIALCLFCFTIPFESVQLDEGGFVSVSRVTGILLFLAALSSPKYCFKLPNAVFIWVLVWFVAVLCSMLMVSGSHNDEAMLRIATLFQMMFAVWIVSNLTQFPRFLSAALWSIGIGSFLLSLLPHFGFGGALIGQSEERVVATGFDANVFASSIVIGCVAMVSATQGRGKAWWLTMIAWLLTFASAYMVVKSGSRGALLSLIVGLSMISLAKDSPMRTMVRVGVVLTMLLAVIILVLETPSMRARFERTIQRGDLAQRQYLYRSAFEMIQEKPFFGWGPVENQYELYARESISDHYNLVIHQYDREIETHNLILGVLTEQGLAGFIPIMFALCMGVVASWKVRSTWMGITPLAILICALSYNMTFQGVLRKITWVPVAVAVGAYGVAKGEKKRYVTSPILGADSYAKSVARG